MQKRNIGVKIHGFLMNKEQNIKTLKNRTKTAKFLLLLIQEKRYHMS